MAVEAGTRASLHNELAGALERGELELRYQPLVDTTANRIFGAEALLRWRRAGRGLVAPMEFLPILEETGLIVPVGEWIVEEACRRVRVWEDAGHTDLRIAVNIAPRQLEGTAFIHAVEAALAESRLEPGRLVLELTESALIHDSHATIASLDALHALGVRISIDDFGTGYSNLAYVKRLPVDTLKLDRYFVSKVDQDPVDATIVTAVQQMATGLGLDLVAEGVETRGQLDALVELGARWMQGYYFAEPLEAESFLARLAEPPIPEAKPE